MGLNRIQGSASRIVRGAGFLCAIGLTLGACGRNTPPMEVSAEQAQLEMQKGRPVDLYTRVGGRIKTCWFNPLDPLLKDHVFRAEAPVGGRAQISVYEIAPGGRLGQKAFAVNFTPDRSQTGVSAQNIRMQPALAAQLAADVRRFAGGDTSCSRGVASFDDSPEEQQRRSKRRPIAGVPLGGETEE